MRSQTVGDGFRTACGSFLFTTAVVALVIAFAAFACASCSHSSSSGGPQRATTPSLATGEWRGRWIDESSQTEGNLMLVLGESAGTVAGTLQMDAPSCVSAAQVTGTCDGFQVAVEAGSPEFLLARGAFYDGGDRLIGTWTLAYPTATGLCTGHGTFDVRRLGAEPAALEEPAHELVIVESDGQVTRRTVRTLRQE